jgi:predicted KAP-like P-loop ATPase
VHSVSAGVGPLSVRLDPNKLANLTDPVTRLVKSISELLESSEKRLVVFVDDLDRLSGDELLLALNLVRLSKLIRGVVYVLAFDREVLSTTLATKNTPRDYIAKIITIDTALPKVQQTDIDRMFIRYVDSVVDRYSIDFEDLGLSERFNAFYRKTLRSLLGTVRNVKRYANAIAFSLPLVLNEVNYADFLILEALRLFYPAQYGDIHANKENVRRIRSTGVRKLRRGTAERAVVVL